MKKMAGMRKGERKKERESFLARSNMPGAEGATIAIGGSPTRSRSNLFLRGRGRGPRIELGFVMRAVREGL